MKSSYKSRGKAAMPGEKTQAHFAPAILLVEPENPDNIGAVVRAMKNMALDELRLVSPVRAWRRKGRKMAVSAVDLLEKAREFDSVEAAVADLHLVIGTTRRGGPKRGTFIEYDAALKKIRQFRQRGRRTALMFGRESKGLDNDALRRCDWITTLPASPEFPSINLAQAVMIMAFSLFEARPGLASPRPRRGHVVGEWSGLKAADRSPELLTQQEVIQVLDTWDEALRALGYDEQADKMPRIRASLHRLFKRSGLLPSEAQMFRGLVRRIVETQNIK